MSGWGEWGGVGVARDSPRDDASLHGPASERRFAIRSASMAPVASASTVRSAALRMDAVATHGGGSTMMYDSRAGSGMVLVAVQLQRRSPNDASQNTADREQGDMHAGAAAGVWKLASIEHNTIVQPRLVLK